CFEFLCRAMMGGRSLLEALQRGARFMGLVLHDLRVSIVREGGAASLQIAETRPLQADRADPRRIFAFEWLLRLMHGLACWMAGRDLALNAVAFPYPRPAHAADYELIYTARSSFDAPLLVASMNANLLDLPVRRDEVALAAFLDGAPGKIAALYRRDREMVRRVRDIVATSLPAPVTLEDAARRLNLSTRSLHRRLHEEGSNLRAIKDAVRRDMALARLEKTDTPVAQIAFDLGYADPSTFFRAFVEWTGVAPTEYRKRLAPGRQ
ncbi:MAG: AraC family transcriptional regulator ligand-binding domain-containing protein, partial [Rhodocyclaceae bacterium]|nr:AraC family transcriptional regulator ligand-binding domain-containing protein [Rhodocyclaceae bacterium]